MNETSEWTNNKQRKEREEEKIKANKINK